MKKISCGILKSTADLVLFTAAYGIGLLKEPPTVKGVLAATRWAQGVDSDSVSRSVKYLRSKGWLKGGVYITAEGQKRLETFIPQPRTYPRRWNGIWYLVSFDIPEKMKFKRNNLRSALLRIGFGKLHASLWISPYNFLGDVHHYCEDNKLDDYVILATSEQMGTQMSGELAERVWRLEKLNVDYARWIHEYNSCQPEHTQKRFELMFTYGDLVRRDPFLPKPLLPDSWHGFDVHKLFQSSVPSRFSISDLV